MLRDEEQQPAISVEFRSSVQPSFPGSRCSTIEAAERGLQLPRAEEKMQRQYYLKQRLVEEARELREEADCLPPGDLRRAVEEIAEYVGKATVFGAQSRQ